MKQYFAFFFAIFLAIVGEVAAQGLYSPFFTTCSGGGVGSPWSYGNNYYQNPYYQDQGYRYGYQDHRYGRGNVRYLFDDSWGGGFQIGSRNWFMNFGINWNNYRGNRYYWLYDGMYYGGTADVWNNWRTRYPECRPERVDAYCGVCGTRFSGTHTCTKTTYTPPTILWAPIPDPNPVKVRISEKPDLEILTCGSCGSTFTSNQSHWCKKSHYEYEEYYDDDDDDSGGGSQKSGKLKTYCMTCKSWSCTKH